MTTPTEKEEERQRKVRERSQRYRQNHPEKVRESCRHYSKTHREQENQKAARYREKHREEINERARQYRKLHHDRVREQERRSYAKHRDEHLKKMRAFRIANIDNINERKRQAYTKTRETVFSHYGWECECCGESNREFLSIDHINGDGAAHRRAIGQSALYAWLIKSGFPEGFRTLCMNCNWSYGVNDYCPHQVGGDKDVA